jgi:single-strand DNA-binding protein
MTKGSEIFVEGKIQTRSWDDADGNKKYRTEIIALQVQFGAKPKNTQVEDGGYQSSQSDDAGIEFPDDDINPEDIPF